MDVYFSKSTKRAVANLLRQHHYIGPQCADPSFVFVWKRGGGLFGDCGEPCAAALFAPPASFAWGPRCIELIRLVRNETEMPPLTKLLSESMTVLRQASYQLVVAYADPSVGHHGGIYQAGSWCYIGMSTQKVVWVNRETGKRSSQRSFDQSNYDKAEWDKVKTCRKHTYIFPLTRQEKIKWQSRRLPYPKPKALRECGYTGAT